MGLFSKDRKESGKFITQKINNVPAVQALLHICSTVTKCDVKKKTNKKKKRK